MTKRIQIKIGEGTRLALLRMKIVLDVDSYDEVIVCLLKFYVHERGKMRSNVDNNMEGDGI